MPSIELPHLVHERAMNNGAAGQRWLETLPAVVADLAERWGLEIGATYAGGTAGYVAACTDGDGNARVLKIALPLTMNDRQAFTRAAHVHRIAAGRGCVRLVDVDDASSAMLLERLGPNLAELGLALTDLLAAIASSLRDFWRPVDDDPVLRSGVDQAAWLAGFIESTWTELGEPCDREVIDRAMTYCERRQAAFDPARAVLAHGDAHGWNTVVAGDGTYRLVDPEGLWTVPEHDLAVPMREYNEPLLDGDTSRLVRARAELLASWCDADAEAVWEWGFIERVSTGLANLHDFDHRDGGGGDVFLEVARRSR